MLTTGSTVATSGSGDVGRELAFGEGELAMGGLEGEGPFMTAVTGAFTEGSLELAETDTTRVEEKMAGVLGLQNVAARVIVGSTNKALVAVEAEGREWESVVQIEGGEHLLELLEILAGVLGALVKAVEFGEGSVERVVYPMVVVET